MILNSAKRYSRGITISLVVVITTAFFCYHFMLERGPIYTFNEARDTKAILDIFDKNWYWLIANDDSSPAFMLKYRTPNTNPVYFGKMNIKVLRENDQLAGFITYFREKQDQWRILFLAVDERYRSKGYGEQLARYAIDDMVKRGAQTITLWTRLANLPAQRIYKRLGFVEVYDTPGGFIYFEYIP